MELLPMGPVMIIDTPGIDDEGYLGDKRVRKTKQVLNKTDVAVLVVDSAVGNRRRMKRSSVFSGKRPAFHCRIQQSRPFGGYAKAGPDEIFVSALSGMNIEALKETDCRPGDHREFKASDRRRPDQSVRLCRSGDAHRQGGPEGALILPQQQTIAISWSRAAAIVVKEFELRETLEFTGKKPRLVITDSQVFAKVSADTPRDVRLTIIFNPVRPLLGAST
jgi:predicted GTPase